MADWLDPAFARPAYHGIKHSASVLLPLLCAAAIFAFCPASLRAAPQNNSLPPQASQAIEKIYSGDSDGAIALARTLEQSQPDDPVGYLIEGEARWWVIYCQALSVRYGMVDDWRSAEEPGDSDYFDVADKAIQLADSKLKTNDTADMHLYAGLGWALKARLYGLRNENRATAHAGVRARSEFLRALKLDPSLADADTGLGLYNYYIGTLSGFVKILRFFMGIPGGSKSEGIRQLTLGMNNGELTAVDARFYLAKNLRTYDHKYEQALGILQPLVATYPRNPIFLLLRGNLYTELGRMGLAAADFHSAEALDIANPACAARVRQVAQTFLESQQ